MHFRRPSAAMVVALLALFASLGGVGWAATQLPAGSVGAAQLRSGAVTNRKLANQSVGNWKLAFGSVGARKIASHAVGKGQINANQVQARVNGTCSTGAVTAVNSTGGVTCGSAGSQEFDTSSASPVTVPNDAGSTTIASESLSGSSSYLVLANPEVDISNASDSQQVQVTCKLAVGPTTGAEQTRTWSVETGRNGYEEENAIPLVVTAPSNANAITANVTCSRTYTGGSSPTVTVSSNINALETAGNTTATGTTGPTGPTGPTGSTGATG
jgi:collagen type VII alpha